MSATTHRRMDMIQDAFEAIVIVVEDLTPAEKVPDETEDAHQVEHKLARITLQTTGHFPELETLLGKKVSVRVVPG